MRDHRPRSTKEEPPGLKPLAPRSTFLVSDTPVHGSIHDTWCRSFFLASGESIALDESLPWTHLYPIIPGPVRLCTGVGGSESHLPHRPEWTGESDMHEA